MDFLQNRLVELTGPELSEQTVSQFEQHYGLRLPDDYRQFMLAHNGGLVTGTDWANPDQGIVAVSWRSKSRAEAKPSGVFAGDIEKLVGGPDDLSAVTYELSAVAEMAPGGVLPKGSLPFGRDPGGLFFVLMTSGPETGAVLLWDRTLMSSITTDDLGYVAPSFGAYIQALEPQPDDWDAWYEAHENLADPRDRR